MNPPSSPILGPNMRGVVHGENLPDGIVTIEYIAPGGFLYIRDAQGRQRNIHQSSFVPMPQIPSKYREHVFHAFAHIWGEALRAYPQSVVVTPTNLAIDTFVRKMRESRVAKNEYKWQHPAVSESLWAELAHLLEITPSKEGKVIVGIKNAPQIPFVGNIEQPISTLLYDNPQVFEQFCFALSTLQITPKIDLRIEGLNQAIVDQLEQRYNIGFLPDAVGKYWTVIY